MSVPNWYALYVASRHERQIAKQLSRLGITVMVPMQKQWRQWSDRKKEVEVVLFPNYVFAALRPGQMDWVNKRNLEKFYGFVKRGNEAVVLSGSEVMLLQKIAHTTAPVEICTTSLAPGAVVEITSGPLRHLRGHILAINGCAKIQLAIPSLQCFARVEVSKGAVKLLG